MYQWLIPGAVYLGKKKTPQINTKTHTHTKKNKQKNKCLHSVVQKNTFKFMNLLNELI